MSGLAHAGGNVTASSIQGTTLGTKKLELLHEIVPGLVGLAVFHDGVPRAFMARITDFVRKNNHLPAADPSTNVQAGGPTWYGPKYSVDRSLKAAAGD